MKIKKYTTVFQIWWFVQSSFLLFLLRNENLILVSFCIFIMLISITWSFNRNYFMQVVSTIILLLYSILLLGVAIIFFLLMKNDQTEVGHVCIYFTVPLVNIILSVNKLLELSKR